VLPLNFACPNLLMQRDGVRTGISDAARHGRRRSRKSEPCELSPG